MYMYVYTYIYLCVIIRVNATYEGFRAYDYLQAKNNGVRKDTGVFESFTSVFY